jgi:hypothetical protein
MSGRLLAERGNTVIIPTEENLKKLHDRLDRNNARDQRNQRRAGQVIEKMRRGSALHHSFAGNRHWFLTDGTPVAAAVAVLVREELHIVDVGDALFSNIVAQTFRYTARPRRRP